MNNKVKWIELIIVLLLFYDLDLTAIIFGGRIVSVIALVLLLVVTAILVIRVLP